MTIPARNSTFTGDDRSAHTWLDELRSRLTGELISAESPHYDEARKVQDISVDGRPLAIVRAADAQDVAVAVEFARDHDYPLAVRSGGHSLARNSMADGAIVADLSGMTGIEIDPASRTARVQAGATTGDLVGPANEHGLALSTGDTSSVGFGGLTTGGGIGFMVRKYGLTIDSLLSAQVVTAAGEIVTASADEHPDLFWAIRGGGGNFGVVTEFTFRLAPVGQILGGALILPATRDVIRGFLDNAASAPDDLTMIGNLMHAPPVPGVPEDLVGKLVFMVIVCWTGSEAEGQRVLEPLRALATPLVDSVRPMPYSSIYLSTAHQAIPHAAAIRSMLTDDLSDSTLDAVLDAIQNPSSPFNVVQFRGLGGQMARVEPDETAFAHRGTRFLLSIIAAWLDPAEDGSAHRAWTASLWQTIGHEGSGVYVNFLENEGEDRIRDAYPAATLARLRNIKRTYDPQNIFRFNQNIAPAQ